MKKDGGMAKVELSEEAQNWLATGDRGQSSNTLFGVMTGIPLWGRWGKDHPWDPDDFVRCEKLLRAVPEFRPRLQEMAAVSPVWARLVENWQHIVSLIEAEASGAFDGHRGTAPEAYKLMKTLIDK